MPQQQFKLHISLNYAVIPQNVVSERVVVVCERVEVKWSYITHILVNLIIN